MIILKESAYAVFSEKSLASIEMRAAFSAKVQNG
jgi:hypothetical protein